MVKPQGDKRDAVGHPAAMPEVGYLRVNPSAFRCGLLVFLFSFCHINRTPTMQVTTIGFTQKSAQRFFTLLAQAEVRTVLDVRLNNISQLAGFSKKPDLEYFLSELLDIKYIELRELTPERDHLKRYQSGDLSWGDYSSAYIELLAKRRVESNLDVTLFNGACLLCSERSPDRCHRRLAVDYLNSRWSNRLNVEHLL